jgi:hypothetical protein
MPQSNKVPALLDVWFTLDIFEKIFPYAATSVVFAHDNKPFWNYQSFINSIKYMNGHKDKRFHNFCSDSSYTINKYELAAFLANLMQETGDPSIKIPYPWLWPPASVRTGMEYGFSGGLMAIMEGSCAAIAFHPKGTVSPIHGDLNHEVILTKNERYMIGLSNTDIMSTSVMNLASINQPGFGLGTGGPSFQDGLTAVSDDGTLYGDNPVGNEHKGLIKPSKECILSLTDRRYAALGVYAQYGGRGGIQLSYNFNYSWVSLELFNDYRLVRYPNLITTTDRTKFNGKPEYFGFPGKNPNGNNKLPIEINSTTPPARMMSYITAICFWMLPRSGRSVSCHQCMLEPTKIGITGVNLIVNNDSGCINGTWAWNKVQYYIRICKILNIDPYCTIICPPNIK